MDRWQLMRIFVRVADCGGFAKAARELRVSPPAVTRSIAALEALLGVRLLVRTTRSARLTEAGRRYVDDCRRILGEIEEAEAAAAGFHAVPGGTLTVTASVQFGRIYVLPIVMEYLSRHAAAAAHALFVDRVVNLAEEGVDVAIRIAHLPDSSMSAARVGSVRRVVCASPGYLEAHGTPERPRDLARHVVIGSAATEASKEWRFGPGDGPAVALRPRLVCSTVDAALAAALTGYGVARLLSYQVAPAVAAGRLRIVLDAYEEAPTPIHVVSLEGRRASAKVRTFIDLAVDRLRSNDMVR